MTSWLKRVNTDSLLVTSTPGAGGNMSCIYLQDTSYEPFGMLA
jgi:hypothetical protein